MDVMRAKAAVDVKPRLGARFQTLLRGNTAAKLPGNISMFFLPEHGRLMVGTRARPYLVLVWTRGSLVIFLV